MRRAPAALVAALWAAPLFADELQLKDGRRVQVESPIRVDGKVVDQATRGRTFSVAEEDVAAATLDALPVLVRLKDGREIPARGVHRKDGMVRFEVIGTGQKRQVPAAQVAWPTTDRLPESPAGTSAAPPPPASPPPTTESTAPRLPPFPLTLELTDGRKVEVDELTRKDGFVRFRVAATGVKRRVPEAQVVAPALDSIPQVLQLTDGREIAVIGLSRKDGLVRFEVAGTGQRRQVAEALVVSPALASIPLGGAPPVALPPVTPQAAPPVETVTPPPPVTPLVTPPAPPPAPLAPPAPGVGAVADFEVMPDRWAILDTLIDLLPPDPRIVRGRTADPYNQNTLKGDRPVIGDSVFLVLTGVLDSPFEARRLPLPSGVSTANPGSSEFFGGQEQIFTTPRATVSAELFKGQTAFRPKTWALRITAAGNLSYVRLQEQGAVSIDPRRGRTRRRQDLSLEEAFLEVKLADLSPQFDALSTRVGIQQFVSDFRGFIFSDLNLGARLFGNLADNRWQYNAAYFDLLEKDTNSELNTFERREHKVAAANLFRQDTFAKGYTVAFSFHRSQDEAGENLHFDANDFLVRPARIGTPLLHEIRTNYFGLTTDGHVGRWNVNSALYYVAGTDEAHPLGDRERGEVEQDVRALMGALELSLDKDWARFRASAFFASGDDDADDARAEGFDSIYDFTNFAGGPFSFWNRSAIPLTQTAVLLKGPASLLPSLRSNKFEGQANHVNPGLMLLNAGLDLELTPKLKAIVNASYLRFHRTGALELLLFQPGLRKTIGIDVGAGVVWRPLLNENLLITAGVTALVPGAGFDDLFSSPCGSAVAVQGCGAGARTPFNTFVQLKATY